MAKENNDHFAREIIVKGAREHNLKNIDLTLPRNKFIVFFPIFMIVMNMVFAITFGIAPVIF